MMRKNKKRKKELKNFDEDEPRLIAKKRFVMQNRSFEKYKMQSVAFCICVVRFSQIYIYI